VSAAELRRQADLARRARREAESDMLRNLGRDARILARELYGRRDLDVAMRAIDRMAADLATLRAHLWVAGIEGRPSPGAANRSA
jgi:uncharacterized membrane protein